MVWGWGCGIRVCSESFCVLGVTSMAHDVASRFPVTGTWLYHIATWNHIWYWGLRNGVFCSVRRPSKPASNMWNMDIVYRSVAKKNSYRRTLVISMAWPCGSQESRLSIDILRYMCELKKLWFPLLQYAVFEFFGSRPKSRMRVNSFPESPVFLLVTWDIISS